MSKVILQIYEFELFKSFKEYHAEIVVFGKSISYSDEGIDVSDVTNKDGLEGYELCATFNLGYADIFEYEFQEFYFPRLEKEYTDENYNLYTHNCRFFALNVINLLQPSKAEVGIQVLEDLNNMSIELGKYLKMKSVILLLTSIVLFTVFQIFETCVQIPMLLKDIVIIMLFVMISIVSFGRQNNR